MAENTIKGAEAVKQLTNLYATLALEIDKATQETKQFLSSTQKLPSDYTKALEQLKATQQTYNKALQNATVKQNEFTAQQKESQRIAREKLALDARLSQATSKENKELVEMRVNLQLLNKRTKENAELSSKLTTEYRKQSIRLIQLKREYKDLVLVEGNASKEAIRLRREITKLDTRLKSVDGSVGEFRRSVGNYSKAMRGAVAAARSLAASMGVLGGAFLIAQVVKDAFNTLREFDKQAIAVQKTTNLTSQEMVTFKKAVIDLGLELKGVSIQGLLQSAEIAGQLGIKGSSNILKFSKTIEQLKLTSDIVGEESARQLAKFIEVSQDSVENTDRLGSVITDLGNNFATTERQILSNALEIQKGIAIYEASAEQVLALGAATNSLGSEAEQARSALQKTFKVLNDAAANGKNLEKVLALTGQTAEEFRMQFNKDAIGSFQLFIKGLKDATDEGQNLSNILGELSLNEKRTEAVVGVLAKNYNVLADSINRANTEYVENNALTREAELATTSIDSVIGDVTDAWDGLVLSIDSGSGAFSRFIKGALKDLETGLNAVRKLLGGFTLELSEAEAKGFDKYSKAIEKKAIRPTEKNVAALEGLLEKKKAEQAALEQSAQAYINQVDQFSALTKATSQLAKSTIKNSEAAQLAAAENAGEVRALKEKINAMKQVIAAENLERDTLIKGITAMSDKHTADELAIKSLKELRRLYDELKIAQTGANDEKGKESILIEGTVAWYRSAIAELTKLRDTTAKTEEEYAKFTQQIDNLTSAMKELQGIDLSLDFDENLAGEDLTKKLIEGFQKFKDKEVEEEKRAAEKRRQIRERLAEDILGLEQQITDQSVDLIQSVVFSAIEGDLIRLDEQLAIDNARFESQIASLEGNSAAQDEIRRQQVENEEEVARKRAEIEKKAFLFEQGAQLAKVAIETFRSVAAIKAQAAILAANPVTAALAPLALAQIPLVITSGAIAAGAIIAQTVPQFKEGVRNFSGGPAILGDGGVSEYAVLPNKKVIKTPANDTLYNLPKGTDVYKDQDEFTNQLYKEFAFNGILPSIDKFNSTPASSKRLTKEEFNAGISKLQHTIKTSETSQIIFDERGIHKWRIKNNARTEMLNNRFRGRGRKV